MGFLQRIFGLIKTTESATSTPPANPKLQAAPCNENVIKLLEFKHMMEELLRENRYIAKSGYAGKNPGI